MTSASAVRPDCWEPCAELERAPGADGVRVMLADVVRAGGFAGGVYVHLGHGLRGALDGSIRMEPRCLVATADFNAAQYLKRNYLELDPLVHRAIDRPMPFTWSLAELQRAEPERERFLGVMASWGMRRGVTAPVHDYALGPACLSFYTSDLVSEPGAIDLGGAMVAALRVHVAAVQSLSASNEAAQEGRLSPREMAVLRLAALGRTEQETAVELALSRRGVQFHLARAMAKLDASNKTAAVARAVSVGLIRI